MFTRDELKAPSAAASAERQPSPESIDGNASLPSSSKATRDALRQARLSSAAAVKDFIRRDLGGADVDRALSALHEHSVAEDVGALGWAMFGPGTNEARISDVLKRMQAKGPSYVSSVVTEYQTSTGRSLVNDLYTELDTARYVAAVKDLDPSPATPHAIKLFEAIYGVGTNETKILQTLDALSPQERAETEVQFNKYFARVWGTGATLRQVFEQELFDSMQGDFYFEAALDALDSQRRSTSLVRAKQPESPTPSKPPPPPLATVAAAPQMQRPVSQQFNTQQQSAALQETRPVTPPPPPPANPAPSAVKAEVPLNRVDFSSKRIRVDDSPIRTKLQGF